MLRQGRPDFSCTFWTAIMSLPNWRFLSLSAMLHWFVEGLCMHVGLIGTLAGRANNGDVQLWMMGYSTHVKYFSMRLQQTFLTQFGGDVVYLHNLEVTLTTVSI
jgi:hypothetical protein